MTPPLPPSRRRHVEMLVIATVVTVLAPLMVVLPDQKVALAALPEWPAPDTCMARRLGAPCPGCGLTRSFIHLAHGDWRASLAVHRLGWLLALSVLGQFPYRLWALRRGGVPAWVPWVANGYGLLLIALLIGNWLYNVTSAAGWWS